MKAIVFFDGVCNLCANSVQFIIKNDKNNIFQFASLQSEFAQKDLSNLEHLKDLKTIVLKIDNQYFTESTAVLKIAKYLKFPYFLLFGLIILPPFIRNFIYRIVSKNRYQWFGKKTSCWLPTEELKSKFIE